MFPSREEQGQSKENIQLYNQPVVVQCLKLS